MKREEFIQIVDDHIAKLPKGLDDMQTLREWSHTSASYLSQLSNELKDEMKQTGGTFAEDLKSIAAKHILADPLHNDQTKEAALAPGAVLVNVTSSVVRVGQAGAYIDIRIRTGVVE